MPVPPWALISVSAEMADWSGVNALKGAWLPFGSPAGIELSTTYWQPSRVSLGGSTSFDSADVEPPFEAPDPPPQAAAAAGSARASTAAAQRTRGRRGPPRSCRLTRRGRATPFIEPFLRALVMRSTGTPNGFSDACARGAVRFFHARRAVSTHRGASEVVSNFSSPEVCETFISVRRRPRHRVRPCGRRATGSCGGDCSAPC